MNKKLLSILIIIGLIGNINAAAGNHRPCDFGYDATTTPTAAAQLAAATTAGVQQCLQQDNGQATDPTVLVGTCLAGFFYAWTSTSAAVCTQCAINTWKGADNQAAVGDAARGASAPCTACGTGLVAPVRSTAATACQPCEVGKGLNTGTGLCVNIGTTATGTKTGGRVYTTTDGTAFTLVTCDKGNGYQSAPNGANCDECAGKATGCGTCETDKATCDSCRVGFRNTAASGAATCSACTGECAECDNTGGTIAAPAEKCTKAKDGSYLAANNVVTKCPDNATKCEWDTVTVPATPAVKVTAVKAGYYIKTGATNVATKCPAGKTSAANSDLAQAEGGATSCTISCATQCLNCDVAGVGKCDACENDYYIDAAPTVATAVCVQFNETTRPATCQTASANDAMSCTSCSGDVQFRERDPTAPTADTKFKCTCMAGYTDISNVAAPATKSPICKKCGTGVKNCDAGQTIVCTNAAEQVAGENCAATTAAVPGFFFDTATTAFKACDATCATCAGGDATKCVTCAQITVDTTQLTEQDVTTLSAAWTNGTYTATAPGTCYAKCPEGYQTDPAVRTACEMGSFGNILSAIVLISFIILMF